MPYTDREAFEMFVAAADELAASPFAEQIQKGVSTAIVVANDRLESKALHGPDKNNLKAAVLTIRMFREDNDVISFRNIAGRVANVAVSQSLKDRFNQSRDNFNSDLNRPPLVRVDNVATKREIFETFLYGMYAHNDEAYGATIKKWQQAPFFSDLHAQFYLIIAQFLAAASAMAGALKEMLKEMI
jgi:hypothetical protein